MKRFLAFILFIVHVSFSLAQSDTIHIMGRVLDMSGEAVDGCIVAVLVPQDSTIVSYAMTDESGAYNIHFVSSLKEVLLRLTGFNVKRQVMRISAGNHVIDLRAEEESVVLREVQIKAQRLWGSRDTLNYLVAAYTRDQDRTIGDILRQLPGVTIDEGGTIKYQGTPINHFYIQNMDVLQGRYTLATNGIRADDVATVQVLENHEHVKALQDQVPPESAAINLVLKKKARGVWTRNMDLTLGGDEDGVLWNCGADMMYFGTGRQHFLHYANDNTGKGCNGHQYYGGGGIGLTAMVDVLTPGGAPVGRSMRNNAHAVNLNNLNKLDDTRQLHYNIACSHDVQRRESFARTTYFLPDGGMTVLAEDIAARHTTDDVDVQLTYENNAERKFLNNRLTLAGAWNDGRGTVTSNDAHIGQSAAVRTLGASNATRWVHRTDGGGGFELRSTNSFSSSPQSLCVTGAMDAVQDVRITQVSTVNRFELLRNLRRHRWTIAPDVTIGCNHVGFTASTPPLLVKGDGGINNNEMYYFRASVGMGPVIRYVNGDLRITLRTPFSLSYTCVNNHSSQPHSPGEEAVKRVKPRMSPTVSLLWKANDHFTFNVDGGYAASETPWKNLITSYIMSNYRSMSRNVAQLSDSHQATAHAKVNFKDIFTGWFAYMDASFTRDWSDIIYGTTIGDDGHTVVQAGHMPHHSQHYRAQLNLRKDFDWHAILMEAVPGWSRGESRQLRQDVVQDYHAVSSSMRGRLAFDIVRGYRIDYNCTWSRSRSVAAATTSIITSLNENVALQFTVLPKTLFLNITGSHVHNSGLSGKKDYTFLDAGLKLKTGKMEWRLDVANMLNTRRYVSHYNTDMVEYYTQYYLRPRSFLLSASFNL